MCEKLEGCSHPCDVLTHEKLPDTGFAGMTQPEPAGEFGFDLAPSLGCVFWIRNIKFDRMQMLSAFPANKGADGYGRACSGPVEAVEISLSFISTSRATSGTETAPDRDRSIRVGDWIDGSEVTVGGVAVGGARGSVSKDMMDLALDCIEPYPDDDLQAGKRCQGRESPASDILSLVFEAIATKRGEPVAVALLIDQSGSMNGLVDEAGNQEDEFGLLTPAAERAQISSDFLGDRIEQARHFIRALNDQDKLIVYTFNGNDGVNVPCTLEAEGEQTLAQRCFADSSNRGIYTDRFAGLAGLAKGRTNLWEAVAEAWRFLKDEAPDITAKHIVVIDDGPDTCSAPSEVYRSGRPVCSAIGFGQVRETVLNDWDRHKIRISFVQFQAPGYMEHDARQWEIACLTEGQYLFINSAHLDLTPSGLSNALGEAMLKLRYALGGVWKLHASIPALATDAPFSSGGVPMGAVYALEGHLRLGKSVFTRVSETQPFGIGGSSNSGLKRLAGLDERLALRKPCAGDADCGDGRGECRLACSDQTAICGDFPAPDGQSCDAGQGVCCGGTCTAGASCSGSQ